MAPQFFFSPPPKAAVSPKVAPRAPPPQRVREIPLKAGISRVLSDTVIFFILLFLFYSIEEYILIPYFQKIFYILALSIHHQKQEYCSVKYILHGKNDTVHCHMNKN